MSNDHTCNCDQGREAAGLPHADWCRFQRWLDRLEDADERDDR